MKMTVSVATALCASVVSAAEVTAGWRERAFVETPVDAVQEGKLSVVPGGSLYKTGSGTLTVPLSQIDRTYPETELKVVGGRVLFTDDGSAYTVERPAVLDEADFWVDETSIVSDGNGGAPAWNDVRETAAEGEPRTRRYAEAWWGEGRELTGVNPTIVEKGGFGGVDFGKYGNGQAMIWKNAAGEVSELMGIRHIYMVTTVERGWSSPVQSMKCADLRSSTWGSQWGTMFDGPQVNNPAGSDDAVYYWNGQPMDLCTVNPKDLPNGGFGLMMIDVGFYGEKGCQSGNFFSLQGLPQYTGGDTLHEVIAFTKRLSSEEEQAVRRYLMHKYGLAAEEKAGFGVTVAEGAAVEIASSAETHPTAAAARGDVTVELSGSGSIVKTGDGVSVVTVKNPLASVSVDLEEGMIAQRTPVAVKLAGGAVIDSDGDGHFGDEVTVTTGAASDAIVKTGSGLLVANEIPADVTSMTVAGGTLELRAKGRSGLETVDSPYVAIGNASFESGKFDAEGKPVGAEPVLVKGDGPQQWNWPNWPKPEWQFEVLPGGYHDGMWVFYMDGSGTYNRHNWASSEQPAPDGLWALAMKGHFRAWTVVNVTERGRYELSFKAVARDGKPNGLDVNLSAGEDSAAITPEGHLGYAFPISKCYQTYSYLTGVLEPGRYVLSIADTITDNYDHTQCVDDFRMVRVPEQNLSGAWLLPNGDFEDVEPHMGGFYDPWNWKEDYFNLNRVREWVITGLKDDPTVGGAMSPIQPLPVGAYLNHYNSFSRCSGSKTFPGGGVQLAFLGGTETASLTFTPPAGTWKLACDAKRWQGGTQLGDKGKQPGNLTATVVVGEETLSFGTADISNWGVAERVWPEALTFDGETEVTLTLRLANENGVAITDNFRLVPVGGAAATELIRDGNFPLARRWGSAWTEHPWVNPENGKKMDIRWMTYADAGNQEHFTTDALEGEMCIGLDNTSCVSQPVTIPADGIYRLSFWSMSRPDGPYAQLENQKNPIVAWVERDGVRETIGVAPTPTTNFVQHVFLVNLKAGACEIGLQGEKAEAGAPIRTSMIDCVSLTPYAAEQFEAAPEMSEDLVLSVAKEAKLRLSFAGTRKVRAVAWGSRHFNGPVSAATHPEFVEGPGCLNSRGYGFTVTIR